MTYTELCAAVSSTVENTFEASDLARFAELAEQKIYNAAEPPVMRTTASLACVSGDAYVTLPSGFLRVVSVYLTADGAQRGLLPKDTSYMQEAFGGSTSKVPRAYAVFDSTKLLLGPTPDSTYPISLTYTQYPESIVTAETTWLGDTFDSVLFNGMLLEAARFLKLEQDMLALYTEKFNDSLAEFKEYVGTELRTDNYRR